MSAPGEAKGSPGRIAAVALVALLLGLLLGRALSRVASEEPADGPIEISAILVEPDTLTRIRLLAHALADAGPEQLDAIRAAFDSVALDGGDTEGVLFAQWWAQFDPKAALAWADAGWRKELIGLPPAVIRVWARADAKAALAAARGIKDEAVRGLAMESAVVGWDESLVPGVVEYVHGISDDSLQSSAIAALARRRVAGLGFEKALDWAAALSAEDPRFKQRMVAEMVATAAMVEPEAVARWVAARVDGRERTGLPLRVGVRWVRFDPEAAFAWLESLPPGRDREEGAEESFRDWLVFDPDAASAWMEAHRGEAWVEAAAALYARHLSDTEPASALELAGSFESVDRRNTTQTLIARKWLSVDREAAEAWIESAGLPAGVRDRIYLARKPEDRAAGASAGTPD